MPVPTPTVAASTGGRGRTLLIFVGVCLTALGIFLWLVAQAHNPHEVSSYLTQSWVLSAGAYAAIGAIAFVAVLGGIASFVIGLVRR